MNVNSESDKINEHVSFFYYHPKYNPYKIEHCVYFTIKLPDITMRLFLTNLQQFKSETQRILDNLYRLFEINAEIEITYTDSIFTGRYHDKYDIISLDYKKKVRLYDISYLLNKNNKKDNIAEWGFKYNMESPWSSDIKSILKRIDIRFFTRVEQYTRCQITNPASKEYYLKYYEPIIHQNYSPLNNLINQIAPQFSDMSLNIPDNNVNLYDGYQTIPLKDLEKANKEWNLALDKDDIAWYRELYRELEREPTKAEIYDLAQSNSEHSRHWIFNSRLVTDDGIITENDRPQTLFKLVKMPLLLNRNNSRLAFCDNASCINGEECMVLSYNNDNNKNNESHIITYKKNKVNPTLTAETHNFPTGIAPFQGATTGVGGRIRDTLAIGRGGDIISGLAGYCVGNLHIPNYEQPWENDEYINYDSLVNRPLDILIKASNGASDYGNKVGEPIIGGFVRTFGDIIDNTPYHFFKPIMFSAGIGSVLETNTDKSVLDYGSVGWIVCQVGGSAYPIGLGGGSSSSLGQSGDNIDQYQNAVQRGDPEMETRVINFLRRVVNGVYNPIYSIHDQGAGGPANVIKEIIEPIGGDIDISAIPRGDKTMSFLQTWCSEFQEQMTFIIHPVDYTTMVEIGRREGVSVYKVGQIQNTGYINVIDSNLDQHIAPVYLPLDLVLGQIPQKNLYIRKKAFDMSFEYDNYCIKMPIISFKKALYRLLNFPSIASKKYLTNKVDRSVSGLIAQQQCVGTTQLPLSDYSLTALDYTSKYGVVSSIGEGSIIGFINYSTMARKIVGEMLTNLVGVKIKSLSDVKCSANWMWSPRSNPEQAYNMYDTMTVLSEICCDLGIAIDGGKDSVSMHSTVKNSKDEKIKVLSPPTLVLTSYAPVSDITNKVTPDLKVANSYLIYVPFGHSYYNGRLGGSCYQQVTNTVGKTYIDNNKSTKLSNPPNIDNATYFTNVFNTIQYLIYEKYILSCHDISDGGLIITILEMAFTGNKGLDLNISSKLTAEQFWFSEELGVVIEVNDNYNDVIIHLEQANITYKIIGMSTDDNIVDIIYNEQLIINKSMTELRYQWEKTSFELEKRQTKLYTLKQEEKLSKQINNILYLVTPNIRSKLDYLRVQENTENTIYRPKVAILREVGCNGHREMISAFYQAGFEVSEITVQDLIDGSENLENYRGLVFVGGFSYGDVPSAGIGWATVLTKNITVKKQLLRFKQRKNTFSLSICNGCQVMSHIGWVEGDFSLQTNESGRFESRWGMVKIPKNNSIFLSKLEGCILGIWVAHGEGRFVFENNNLNNKQMCCQYVDINGNPTLHYPENPNGSISGIAGLTSKDGRHLVMMPHPERSFLDWQMPYQDPLYTENKKINKWDYTPWFIMFKNTYDWCCSN